MTPSLPQPGNVVRVRYGAWLINEVSCGPRHDAARVQLWCIDAAAAGDPLEVLWEVELGREIVPDQPQRIEAARGVGVGSAMLKHPLISFCPMAA